MFERLKAPPEDPILRLIDMFRADRRKNKIDLGVGVFKDASGNTPIIGAIREAELLLHARQTTKSYVGLAGDADFNRCLAELVLGADHPALAKGICVQTPGGSGALSLIAGLLAGRAETAWVSDPTWSNHLPILERAGLATDTYPYFDRKTRGVDEAAMLDKLRGLGPKDVVVLHGCCHNPTGAELGREAWESIADIAAERKFLPLVDLAYLGFGNGLEPDAFAVRLLASRLPELLVAVSCSKNFGLYRERVGGALLIADSNSSLAGVRGTALSIARSLWSMPPDHGAALVSLILSSPELRADWQQELDGMRSRILKLRRTLASALKQKSGTDDWRFLEEHRGMFSTLMLNDKQLKRLREEFAVYAVGGGRINIAGLQDETQVARFADALLAVV